MPRSQQSLAVTDAYRRQLVATRQRTLVVLAGAWRAVQLEDLERSHAEFTRTAAAAVGFAKQQAATLSDSYVAAFRSSELQRRVSPTGADTERFAQQARDGRPLTEALSVGAIAVKLGLMNGLQPEKALTAGMLRVQRLSAAEVSAAGRESLSELVQSEDDVVGWRRATSGAPCGACLAAATGAVRADDDVPEAHDYCQCVAEPVVRNVPDRVARPTGQELFDAMTAAQQDALFAGRGGSEKADLLRSGDIQLSDLVERNPMSEVPDQITEKPLAALAK